MMAKDSKTLHLVLKRKWWDMIASGEKKEEYREVCHYWAIRLLDRQYRWYSLNTDYPKDFLGWIRGHLKYRADIQFRQFEKVCFHLGYTNTTMTFLIAYFALSMGKEEWGAEPNKHYFIIKLGERIGNGADKARQEAHQGAS